MNTFIIRAAQTAFNQIGYEKSESYQQASVIAQYLAEHFDEYQARTGINDEFELAYQVARDVAQYRAPIRQRLAKLSS